MFNAQAVTRWLLANERTATWLASKAGLTKTTLHRILHGEFKPSLDSLVAIARVTGLQMNELIIVAREEQGADAKAS